MTDHDAAYQRRMAAGAEPTQRSARRACLAGIAFLMVGLPLILCSLYATLDLGTVGPWIPITGIVNCFLLPALAIRSTLGFARRPGLKVLLVSVAAVVGVGCAVLGMNAFIGFTWLFGLDDYHLM